MRVLVLVLLIVVCSCAAQEIISTDECYLEYAGRTHDFYNMTRDASAAYVGTVNGYNITFNICGETAPPVPHCEPMSDVAAWIYSTTECFPVGSRNESQLVLNTASNFHLLNGKIYYKSRIRSLTFLFLCPVTTIKTHKGVEIYAINEFSAEEYCDYQIRVITTIACLQKHYDRFP
jgi:hypothetical protein